MKSFQKMRHGMKQAMLFTEVELTEIKKINTMLYDLTNDLQIEMDWTKMMQLIDHISLSASSVIIQEFVREVRHCLENTATCQSALHTLTVIEALVNNCTSVLHVEMATPKFMAAMEKAYYKYKKMYTRDSSQVSERVLELIQAWGEAFLPHRSKYPLFISTYRKLRQDGVPFAAQYDDKRAPVLTPSAHATPPTTDEFSSLQGPEFMCIAKNTVEMLEEMLHVCKDKGDIEGNEIISEIMEQCKRIEKKLVQCINTAVDSGDDTVVQYLDLNETLQASFVQHAAILKKESTTSAVLSSNSSLQGPAGAKPRHEVDLLDFDSPPQKPKSSQDVQECTINPIPFARVVEEDAFSAFAASRASSSKKILNVQSSLDEDPFPDLMSSSSSVKKEESIPGITHVSSSTTLDVFSSFSPTDAAPHQPPPTISQPAASDSSSNLNVFSSFSPTSADPPSVFSSFSPTSAVPHQTMTTHTAAIASDFPSYSPSTQQHASLPSSSQVHDGLPASQSSFSIQPVLSHNPFDSPERKTSSDNTLHNPFASPPLPGNKEQEDPFAGL